VSYRKKHIKRKVHHLKPKKHFFKKPLFWLCILFLIIIFAIFYFFVFYSKFQITEVLISGNEKIQNKEIENIAWNNINKKIITLGNWNLISKSIFLTSPNIISKNILQKLPQIESVKISKKFPQTIFLEIKERKPFAVFCQPASATRPNLGDAIGLPVDVPNTEKCFYIDKNGIIFEALEKIPENITIVRQWLEDKEIFVGKRVIEKNIIDAIFKLEKILKDNFQIDIKEAIVSSPLRMDIKTSENWQIYFNLRTDTDFQIAKINLLLKDEISKDKRKNLQYIDLRFGDRAYYK
jgi:hypothetical protein